MPEKVSSPVRIAVASTNRHKITEMEAFCTAQGLAVQLLPVPHMEGLEETGATFMENARIKAEFWLERLDEANLTADYILAEDSGFVVPALDGYYEISPFPGVQSNRWLTPERRQALLGVTGTGAATDREKAEAVLSLLQKSPTASRDCYYIAALTLIDARNAAHRLEAEGRMAGCVIAPEENPRGQHGFGYDPIVRPVLAGVPSAKTVAEYTELEKNRFSHRSRALAQAVTWLMASVSDVAGVN
jgi:XTP/dITP diphosphohydrolase